MQCISPILVRSKIGTKHFVPCGKCLFCLQSKRFDWSFRIMQELKDSSSAHFLTMTYNDSHVPEDGSLTVRDLQLFVKRLRKANSVPLRYYAVGEYGTKTQRPHYHAIMFNLDQKISDRLSSYWQKGNCFIGDVQAASVNYVTKYVINRPGDYGDRAPPFSVMSRRPGLGSRYLSTHVGYHKDQIRNYTNVNGVKGRLPRFYKDKLYSPWERSHFGRMSVVERDVEYAKAIDKFGSYHTDPTYYYDERVRHQYDTSLKRINEKNVF